MIQVRYLLLLCACLASEAFAYPDANETWQEEEPVGGAATARHEAAMVDVNGLLYLMGGRGSRPVEIYDPQTRRWRGAGTPPTVLHHFQPVAVGVRIYVIGALTGGYPDEPSVEDVYVFDTETEQWTTAGKLPANRRRGSAAAVEHAGKIYIIGGNTLGHSGGAVAWLDRYDPDSDSWTTLADAPNARDHAYAVVIDGRIYVAGGRQTAQPNPFANTVGATDVYNLATGEWSSVDSLPTQRAGAPVVAYGNELIVIGGESPATSAAHDTVEAYDVVARSWRSLQPLLQGRHSGGAAIIGNTLHVVAGSLRRGGSPESSSQETLDLASGDAPDPDNDGLSTEDELQRYGTDPDDADTDDDGLDDGEEIDLATDPQRADTDGDGLSDGEESNEHQTDPRRADTDGDGVDDGSELRAGTDPLDADDPAGTTTGGTTASGGSSGGEDGSGGSDGTVDTGGTADTGGDDAGGGETGGETGGDESGGGTSGADTAAGGGTDGDAEAGAGDSEDQSRSGGGAASGWLCLLLGSLFAKRRQPRGRSASVSRHTHRRYPCFLPGSD